MNVFKIFLLISFTAVGSVVAQDQLYLSPAGTKTADNSIVILENGNVGLGKANPETKLEVNGRIHAKSVKVDLEGWADFVFLSDYNLPSLTQIEAYIIKYGHLEGVPSEEEVLSAGIDLGQMNTILLQKVEELTLHMIQKEKEIENLEIRITRLEALLLDKNND